MSADFLQALWTPPTGYGELRAIKDKKVSQQFYPLDQSDVYERVADEARLMDERGWDVYIGVLRRDKPGGKAADVTTQAPVLWADIDPYKGGDSITDHSNALSQILQFPLPASIIVDSGHGLHAYWLLRDYLPVGDAQLAMKGIAQDIGGDHTHDPARVLRLPTTHNHKNGESVPVRLLRLDTTRRFRASDFAEYIDKGGAGNGTPAKWHRPTGAVARTDIPPWLDELMRNGAEKGSRSEACFKVMFWLVRYGWDYNQVKAVFMDGAYAIGEKLAEMTPTAANRWFDRTFDAASEAA